ncbi:30S ribosomal protein S9 [Candidatus Roizmanbacteria bacterium RIFCSPLOWO2_01_FULL_37_13]|uniref:30S ribosomal protein S9 n=1 Tax=Candidatus Roizmanbacteria bacterium RIFCSPHIGHO2_02_FULL_38_11 TaxID=1802039 RepID=A0A1F7H317_9BACT|nr:MAG: 30S ribosomal protein S9 [Candidatus Roizmanbacteria bacterium RIFCSPHIGHO2_02_FULL_38_11]OGK40940.1 MAG: 30S ribosomal protein S9 [Candidatus Roizmanbacteria bacterium RIFCSPLOWO2_01_FULL_37_13]
MAKKSKALQYYEAVGRRKEAMARVRLFIIDKHKEATVSGMKVKAGEIFVNKKPISQVFPAIQEKNSYLLPLKLTQNENRFAVTILVEGGGRTGQLDAITHGLARAIEKVDKLAYRPILKKNNLLRRDARAKERRKVGTGGKARRKKQSPKR